MSDQTKRLSRIFNLIKKMIDDELVDCPNCQCLCPGSELRPVSIGCVYRQARKAEEAHQALVKAGQGQTPDGKVIPIRALFSDFKTNWIPLPPILDVLHYNLREIAEHKSLQKKDTHICQTCYDAFVDDEEVKYRLEVEAKKHSKSKAKFVGIVSDAFTRESDRKNDFTFTNLQTKLRTVDRLFAEKRAARQQLIVANSQPIDWEGMNVAATREIKRIQSGGDEMSLSNSELQVVEHSPSRTSPSKLKASAHHSPSRHGQLVPVSNVPLDEDELNDIAKLTLHGTEVATVCSYDVSLPHRFMHDLWTTMCSVMEFGAEDPYLYMTDVTGKFLKHHTQAADGGAASTENAEGGQTPRRFSAADEPSPTVVADPDTEGSPYTSPTKASSGRSKVIDKVPVHHPFFALYRKNQLRLPTPPVPTIVQTVGLVSSSAEFDDPLLEVDQKILANGKTIVNSGLADPFVAKELSTDERVLLSEIVGNEDITVDEDADDEPFDFEDPDEGLEEDEDFDEVYDET